MSTDPVEEKLYQERFHYCSRCRRFVQRVIVNAVAGGFDVAAECHGRRTFRRIAWRDIEDRTRLDWFKPLPAVEDVQLSDNASRVFDLLAGLAELLDLDLVMIRRGELLPRLTTRGHELRSKPHGD